MEANLGAPVTILAASFWIYLIRLIHIVCNYSKQCQHILAVNV